MLVIYIFILLYKLPLLSIKYESLNSIVTNLISLEIHLNTTLYKLSLSSVKSKFLN